MKEVFFDCDKYAEQNNYPAKLPPEIDVLNDNDILFHICSNGDKFSSTVYASKKWIMGKHNIKILMENLCIAMSPYLNHKVLEG